MAIDIGLSTELFVLKSGNSYAKDATTFADLITTTSRTNLPYFNPAGRGTGDRAGGWTGYTNEPALWQKIARLRDISGPEASVGEVDITSNDSPDRSKEYIPGIKDPGNLSADMIFDIKNASQVGSGADSMQTMYDNQEVRHYALRLPVFRVGDTITDILGTSRTLLAPNRGAPYTTSMSVNLTAAATSLVVASVDNLVAGDNIMIDSEIMTVTSIAVSSRTLTIVRAAFGTTAAAHDGSSTAKTVTINKYPNPASIDVFANQPFFLFDAFITSLGNEIPMEDVIMRSTEFRITGRVEVPALAS